MKNVLRTHKKPRKCNECPAIVYGQEQLCPDCHHKRTLCQEPGCGKPHGGPVPTTKYCLSCRAGRRRKPRSPKNPPWTPAEDELLRAIYAQCHGREAGRRLRAAFPTRPSWSFKRRAQILGAATVRKKEPRWSPEEDAIVREFAWMSPERVCLKLRDKGYPRSVTGVSIRMKRMRVRQHIDGLTAQGLATMLHIDVHVVLRWIQSGWLKAERYGTSGDNHDHHHITTDAIRAFFFEHAELIELSKLERAGSKMWFLELLTGGRIAESGAPAPAPATATTAANTVARTVPLYGERVTLTALSDICGRTAAELLHRIDDLGMSVQEAAFGADAPVAEPVEASPLARAIATQLRELMRRHRAGAASLAGWTGLPAALIERMLEGTFPLVAPALATCVEKLDGELRVTVRARQPRPEGPAPSTADRLYVVRATKDGTGVYADEDDDGDVVCNTEQGTAFGGPSGLDDAASARAELVRLGCSDARVFVVDEEGRETALLTYEEALAAADDLP